MKKILFAVESYYPKISGVPVVVKYLAEGLASDLDYEIHVATRIDSGLKEVEVFNEVTIHRFNLNYDFFKRTKGELDKYKKFLFEEKFDCIILECTQSVTTDYILKVADSLDTKLILHSHGFSGLALKPFEIMSSFKHTLGNTRNYFVWKYYYKNFLPRYLKFIDNIITLSAVDNDFLYFKKLNRYVDILPNAADPCFFDNQICNHIKEYTLIDVNNYFISIAYYSDVKNQIGILEQYYKFSNDNNYSMIFIGTEKNNYYEKLIRLKGYFDKKYGNRNVFFLTNVKRSDISGILSGAKLYLSGSRREAFSISLIESMALGIPFVATNVGNSSVLPGGIVVDDISNMHKKMEKLIKKEELYNDLSTKGRKYSRQFCQVDVAIDNLKKIIEK